MDTIDIEQKNETDTGATVPASTATAAYQEQSATKQVAAASDSCNQNLKEPGSATFASKCGRITFEELCAHLDSLPIQQSPEEEDSKEKAAVIPPISTPILNQPEVPQKQPTQSWTVWETSPPTSKAPSAASLVPVPFQTFPQCPAPGDGCNAWCLSAAYACKRYGLTPDQAATLIRDHLTRSPRVGEIERAVKKAYLTDSFEKLQPSITTSYNEAELRALAYKVHDWDSEALKAVSPVDVRKCTTIQYLRHIFDIGERVVIATRINDRGTIWLNDPRDPDSREDELDSFQYPSEGQGAWFLSNPVNGEGVKLERLKSAANHDGVSFRAEENLTSFRYLVLESDEAPQGLWGSALVQLPLPIVSIVTSGGKSLHALVRINASNGDHWRAIKQRIGPALVPLAQIRAHSLQSA